MGETRDRIPAHVRGSGEEGIVISDYKVEAPS